jgi:hypothetical protein
MAEAAEAFTAVTAVTLAALLASNAAAPTAQQYHYHSSCNGSGCSSN